MTLIAGIVSRGNHPLPVSACDSLRQLISRHPSDEVMVFKDERSYLLKMDASVYGEPAVKLDENGALTLLAGEPLLSLGNADAWQSRELDVALIHDDCVRGGRSGALKRAQGVFCAVHYEAATGTLKLIADKLCLRPLYYWVDERYVIFASALRILEGVVEIPKKMDVRAVTEIIGLGYPLAQRTPYADICLLKAAEVVLITEKKIARSHYWRWDEITPSSEPEEKLLEKLSAGFESAVARRNRSDTTTIAYLSGGLDSRCVVAALRSQNVRVHTFNFARPHTQDQIFGLDFARQVEAIHEEVPKEAGDHVPDYSSLMAEVWNASKHRAAYPAERPALVWSGEGGSVDLGHVHMSEKIVELMRAGQLDAAIEEYSEREYVYISPKLFRPEVFATLAGVIHRGIREELESLHAEDPARSFYLFLMLNDQRRKLARHFENIDLHRLEFQLPFFDSAFLAAIVAAPVDLCLRHKLYVKWLAYFHPAVTRVPWQAYPGHEPCPLPIPQGLTYQWADEYQAAERATQKQRLTKQATALLRAADFPERILNKRNLRLATWVHATGWRNYEHIIEAAHTFHTYWQKSNGEYALPSSDLNTSELAR
ncbi:MAG TPA: asparagine synthase-related protein [Pyrinomonadaceae bacterium]